VQLEHLAGLLGPLARLLDAAAVEERRPAREPVED